jgi:hypothetical protein
VPSPDESYLVPEPPTTKPPTTGPWRTNVAPPRPDTFIADELKRDAEKQPPAEPEKRDPIDPTPLLAVFGGTIIVLLLVGLGFFALDRYIDEIKRESRGPVQVESVDRSGDDAKDRAK